MAKRTFYVSIPILLAANGQNTGEYDVGQGNTLTVHRMYQKSAGAFDIIDISDSFGNKYGNMSTAKPIDGNILTDVAADNNNPAELPEPIIVSNNGRIQFTLQDTSSSPNQVYIYLIGELDN